MAPILSLILKTDLILIFKVLYPLIFSLVPVILLKAYEKLFGQRLLAELSVMFFMFLFTFFTEMMALARQIIAEVFLALLVYATVKRIKPMILTLFLVSLAISHYGTAYLTMFALFLLPFLSIVKSEKKISNINVVLFAIVTLLWYQHFGGGIEFYYLVNIGYETFLMLEDIFNPQYSQGLALIMGSTTLMRELAKWINLIAQGLISIGILTIIFRILSKYNQAREHMAFYLMSFAFFAFDVAGIILPLFANRLNTTRLYHITLFFLAPYLTIGGITVGKIIHKKIIHQKINGFKIQNVIKALALFLLIYFLFNSGFMLEIAHDPQPAQWLDKIHSPSWSIQELLGAKWIIHSSATNLTIYSGELKFPLFLGLGVKTISFTLEPEIKEFVNKPILIYLGKETTKKGEVQTFYYDVGGMPRSTFLQIKETKLWQQLLNSNLIYVSKDVLVYNK
ncbi:MAG: DUF2206 domain-containing protein [Nitrososphaeria archaeon]|nr:DUF2206 domain-containing protein [Nitrososphaeria archaeon]